MDRRIKIIYLLTVIAAVVLFAAQIYWLFNQYTYSLQLCQDEVYAKIINVAEADRNLRRNLQGRDSIGATKIGMNIKTDGDNWADSKIEWLFETFSFSRKDISGLPKTFRMQDSLWIDSLLQTRKGIKFQFKVETPERRRQDMYDAIDRFRTNQDCPFTVERFDSLLRLNGLNVSDITVETVDSIIWNPRKINPASLLHPEMKVTYPFDILQQQQCEITYRLPMPVILKKMMAPLICSLTLSFLLTFCLLYQINTIFRQRRIEELRKNFVHTMIHELKRPVTTLKMCISYMKNEKMMRDGKMKEEILRNSQNELDNLSSYFFKLRDLLYTEVGEIPLNLSTFNLKELVERCIEKQNLPNDRKIDVGIAFERDDYTITADKMHIDNIICNLLENAVKYSDGETRIDIRCQASDNKYRIEVSDNGFGISETESEYVFDKFFRSTRIIDLNIPGIGLGLCYVKLLVVAHKGTVTLQSVLGKGSTFIIIIPERQ